MQAKQTWTNNYAHTLSNMKILSQKEKRKGKNKKTRKKLRCKEQISILKKKEECDGSLPTIAGENIVAKMASDNEQRVPRNHGGDYSNCRFHVFSIEERLRPQPRIISSLRG